MADYMHWRKFDWSFNSICVRCHAMIANAQDEADLAEHERDHICAGKPPAGGGSRLRPGKADRDGMNQMS